MVEYLIENLARADIETTTSQDNYMIITSFVSYDWRLITIMETPYKTAVCWDPNVVGRKNS